MTRAATTDSNLIIWPKVTKQVTDKVNKEASTVLIKNDTKQILNKNVSLASVNSTNLEEILQEE